MRVIATGRSDYANQINNVLCFPGMLRGLLDARAKAVTPPMLLAAARAIAGVVGAQRTARGLHRALRLRPTRGARGGRGGAQRGAAVSLAERLAGELLPLEGLRPAPTAGHHATAHTLDGCLGKRIRSSTRASLLQA